MYFELIVDGILFFVVRMAYKKQILKVFSCPHGHTKHFFDFERFLAVCMALPKKYLNGF